MFEEVTCGCFYWAWIVFVDMQIYLLIPIYVIAYMKSRTAGIMLQLFLMVFTFIQMIILTQNLHMKAGPLAAEGYYMFANLMNKPWGKLNSQALGVLLAFVYFDILKYRKLVTDEAKNAQYPKLHFLHSD